MKIHIIGGSGTGKTFISEKISAQYHIPHFDLDDIFWDNNATAYGTKTSIEKRTELLNEVLTNDNWVIEGVFYDWLDDCFSSADIIFILKCPQIICSFRIIRRFIKRKLGLQKGKKETFMSLFALLSWTAIYQKRGIPKILKSLHDYKNKVVLVKKSQNIMELITGTL